MSERVFLRGLSGEKYGLGALRDARRAAPRVRRGGTAVGGAASAGGAAYEGLSAASSATWLVGPGDDPFLTQSLQVHTVDLAPGGSNDGHGHQNEALFYVLEGRGHEVHDGERYDWESGDAVVVHADSAHQHFNDDPARAAHGLIFKAKTAWMYLGLWQQGRGAEHAGPGWGAREDWSRLWTPGASAKKKVVKRADTRWETTRDGLVRVITSARATDVRIASVDLAELELPPRFRFTPHWHMADEVLYVVDGTGESVQWDVAAEIADRYYAHIATKPTTWSFSAGDVVYVPPNTVHQLANTGDRPARLLVAQNRLFKLLGYDAVVYPDVPER